MEGVSDLGFRTICHDSGASLTFTEMIRASSLVQGNKATLSLVDPFTPSPPTGIQLLVNKKEILKKAKVISFQDLKRFDYKIATTSQLGTDYNIARSPLKPDELTNIIKPKANIAIIFGRESNGLTNQEINQMDFIVTIPTSKKYQTMNLSHSVAIILYELMICPKQNSCWRKRMNICYSRSKIYLKEVPSNGRTTVGDENGTNTTRTN